MSNELATRVGQIHTLIQNNADKLKAAMPSILTPERFVRIALTAINKTPKLAECSQTSLLSCLMDLAQLGIEPDGRRAHLIPYGNQATLIMDYKGLIELGRRSGQLSLWRPELVCENDVFEYDKGQVTQHKINFKEARGKPYAVYSYVKFKDGSEDWEVMTIDEVESIRERSKAKNAGPWKTDYFEMAKKTVIRRHSKRLPLSAEFRDALEKDFDKMKDITPHVESRIFRKSEQEQKPEEPSPEPATFIPEEGAEPSSEPDPVEVEERKAIQAEAKLHVGRPKKQADMELEGI